MEAPSRYAWAPSRYANCTTLPRFFKPQNHHFLHKPSYILTHKSVVFILKFFIIPIPDENLRVLVMFQKLISISLDFSIQSFITRLPTRSPLFYLS